MINFYEQDDKDSTAVDVDEPGVYVAIAMIASGATPDLEPVQNPQN